MSTLNFSMASSPDVSAGLVSANGVPACSGAVSSFESRVAPIVHIVCFGNLWQEDDGFGIHVFQRLSKLDLPENVQVFEAGISGLNALQFFENAHKVVIVDAMDAGLPVGSVHRLCWNELNPPADEFSTHAIGVDHLFQLLPLVIPVEKMPEIVIIAAQICSVIRFTDSLSTELQTSLEKAIELIDMELPVAMEGRQAGTEQ